MRVYKNIITLLYATFMHPNAYDIVVLHVEMYFIIKFRVQWQDIEYCIFLVAWVCSALLTVYV